MDDLASPAPLPKQEHQNLASQDPMSWSRRTPNQDSVSVTQVRRRPSIGAHSFSSPIRSIEQEIIRGARLPWEDEGAESDDATEPPQVYRVTGHARKRSSTAPRPVPLSALYDYFSNPLAVGSSSSLQGPTSRDKYDRLTPHRQVGSGAPAGRSTLARRITDNSIGPCPVVPDNFYDSEGTIRMKAFVERERDYVLSSRGKSCGTGQGRSEDMNFWGLDGSGASNAVDSARLKREDPFRGF